MQRSSTSFPYQLDHGLMIELYKNAPSLVRMSLMQTCKAWRAVAVDIANQHAYLEYAAIAGCEASISILLQGGKISENCARKLIGRHTSVSFIRAFCGKMHRSRGSFLNPYCLYKHKGKEWIDALVALGCMKRNVYLEGAAKGNPVIIGHVCRNPRTRSSEGIVAIFNGYLCTGFITEVYEPYMWNMVRPYFHTLFSVHDVITTHLLRDRFTEHLRHKLIKYLDEDTARLFIVKKQKLACTDRVCTLDPKVYEVLLSAGVPVCHGGPEDCTLKELLRKFKATRDVRAVRQTILQYNVTVPDITHTTFKIPNIILPIIRASLNTQRMSLAQCGPQLYNIFPV